MFTLRGTRIICEQFLIMMPDEITFSASVLIGVQIDVLLNMLQQPHPLRISKFTLWNQAIEREGTIATQISMNI